MRIRFREFSVKFELKYECQEIKCYGWNYYGRLNCVEIKEGGDSCLLLKKLEMRKRKKKIKS